MVRAAELVECGCPDGMVVVADFQSAGRGTRGRTWQAPPGSCLMFTIVGRPELQPDDVAALPLRVSNAVAGTLHSFLGLACEVDPPNDVTVNGRKLCGVLCSSRIQGCRVEWVLCGIGLNTMMSHEQLPIAVSTSLLIERGEAPSHYELLDRLLDGLWFVRGGAPDGAG